MSIHIHQWRVSSASVPSVRCPTQKHRHTYFMTHIRRTERTLLIRHRCGTTSTLRGQARFHSALVVASTHCFPLTPSTAQAYVVWRSGFNFAAVSNLSPRDVGNKIHHQSRHPSPVPSHPYLPRGSSRSSSSAYSTFPWTQASIRVLHTPIVAQMTEKYCAFYGTRRYVTVQTSGSHSGEYKDGCLLGCCAV
jgi:hypothetical protein